MDHFRPDCESPARSDTFGKPRTICNLTTPLKYVKPFNTNFSQLSTPLWKLWKPRQITPFSAAGVSVFSSLKVSEIVLGGFLRTTGRHQQRERAAAGTTPREIEIIRLLAEEKTNKEAQPGIALRTAETHRAKIMLKLGLHSLAGLIHYALSQGVIPPQRKQL